MQICLLCCANAFLEVTKYPADRRCWTIKLETTQEPGAIDGLRRLAFCKINDAVKILLAVHDFDAGLIAKLDLFPVSEIKKSKDGGLEIKFYDRLKAFEMLINYTGCADDAQNSFYGALESAAKSVSEADEV